MAHVLSVPCRDFLDTGFREGPDLGRVPTRHANGARYERITVPTVKLVIDHVDKVPVEN